mgnify:CR=1 FL=1
MRKQSVLLDDYREVLVRCCKSIGGFEQGRVYQAELHEKGNHRYLIVKDGLRTKLVSEKHFQVVL